MKFLYTLFLFALPFGGYSATIDKRIYIQPIAVCSDDGTIRANSGLELYSEVTRKVYAQAGVDIQFLPWRYYSNSFFLDASTSSGGNGYLTLSRTVGAQQSETNSVMNVYFVRTIDSGNVYGASYISLTNDYRTGLAIADISFTNNKRDIIAHELGHNLALDHTTLGCTGATNIMWSSPTVPSSAANVYPDGQQLLYLTPSQIAQIRDTRFTVDWLDCGNSGVTNLTLRPINLTVGTFRLK
jgi:hypothetical protein